MALTSTILGKNQRTMQLLSEGQVLKSREKAQALGTASFVAGDVVIVGSTGLRKAITTDTNAVGLIGVAFDSHVSTLDECAGSGLGTIIWGEHEGRTKSYDTDQTYVKGDKLFISSNAGKLSNTTTANGSKVVGYVEDVLGGWLRYRWIGAQS